MEWWVSGLNQRTANASTGNRPKVRILPTPPTNAKYKKGDINNGI